MSADPVEWANYNASRAAEQGEVPACPPTLRSGEVEKPMSQDPAAGVRVSITPEGALLLQVLLAVEELQGIGDSTETLEPGGRLFVVVDPERIDAIARKLRVAASTFDVQRGAE